MDKLIEDINNSLLSLFGKEGQNNKPIQLAPLIDQFFSNKKYDQVEFELLRKALSELNERLKKPIEDQEYLSGSLINQESKKYKKHKNHNNLLELLSSVSSEQIERDIYKWSGASFLSEYLDGLKLDNEVPTKKERKKGNTGDKIIGFTEFLNKATVDHEKCIDFLSEKYSNKSSQLSFVKWIYLFRKESLFSDVLLPRPESYYLKPDFTNSLVKAINGEKAQAQQIKIAIENFFTVWETYESDKKNNSNPKIPTKKFEISKDDRDAVKALIRSFN